MQDILICNAKESDPGAFTDRTILESDPHRLIEGIAIAAYAIGASTAVFYLNPVQIMPEQTAKSDSMAREYGIIGHNIFSSGYQSRYTDKRRNPVHLSAVRRQP